MYRVCRQLGPCTHWPMCMYAQIDKASSAEDLLQLCLQALESENGEAGVRERLGLPPQDDSNNGKKRDGGAVQKALLQVGYQ